ncbi:helix-turn-helix domain-containing protein [Streptomyces caatingaensis]|uniref:helix-turn-helix domain-containing protein n=1 Tax=Streptomyces caatingaensis TaxID=1678637 RepID=UPI0019D6FFCE|nr:helix-turn-helix transcriptional regulator [Streptomyces caatingaensis]
MTRSRPPRDLARDPETWPHALIDDPAAAVVQDIARTLATTLADQGRSLRRAAEGSGVNRQAIADLIAGRCWPDIATVARLENFLAVTLYPPGEECAVRMENSPSAPRHRRPKGRQNRPRAPEASPVALASECVSHCERDHAALPYEGATSGSWFPPPPRGREHPMNRLSLGGLLRR